MEAHLQEESKLWTFVVLCQKHIKNARRRSKERNLTLRNSRGRKQLDTFRVLPGVHFMHTIFRFEAREVRSPTLQTVHELELKQRSYGRLKITTSSCAKISQLRNAPLAHERHFTASHSHFATAKWAAKPTFGTRVPFHSPCLHLRSCEPRCKVTSKLQMKLQIISKLRNHLQVVKSHSTCKIKVQT